MTVVELLTASFGCPPGVVAQQMENILILFVVFVIAMNFGREMITRSI
jgi:hypothetical protein